MKRGPILLLSVLALGAALAFLLATPTGLAWLWGLRPAGLEAERLHGRLTGPLTLEGLTLPDGTRIARLDLDLAPAALLHGTLHLTHLHLQGITLPPGGNAGTPGPSALPALPLALQVDRLLVEDLRRGGQILLERLAARLELRPRGWRLEALELTLPGATLTGTAHIAGAPPHDLDGHLTWRLTTTPPLHGETRLAGNLRRPRLRTTLAGALSGRVEAAIEGWRDDRPRWRLEARLQSRDWRPPPALGAPLRTRLALRGTGARGEGELRLDAPRLRLTSPVTLTADALRLEPLRLHAPLEASGALRLALDGRPHRLHLTWRDLDLPPLASPRGELILEGRPDDYRFRIDARLHHPQLPLGRWQAAGRGDRQRLHLARLQGETLGGRLEGKGELDLPAPRPWRLRLSARDLDPGTLDLGPGRVHLELDADGALAPRNLAARLTRLDGRWRGLPLSGQGRIDQADGDWRLRDLTLHLGEHRLRLDGRWGRHREARLDLRAPRLATLHPDLDGRLRLRAHLQQAPDTPPRLQWELEAQDLRWRDARAARLQSQGELRADGAWQGHLDARTLRLARLDLTRLRLDLDGRRQGHRLRIQAEAAAGRLDAFLRGGLDERGRRWTGQVAALRLDALQRRFRLPAPAPLVLARRHLRLDDLCLQAPDSGLCLSARHESEENRLDLDLTHLPLALVRPWLPAPLTAQGSLHGHLRLRLPRGADTPWPASDWDLRGEGIRLRLPPAGELTVETLRLRGGIEQGIAHTRLDLDIPGHARLQAQIPELALDRERPEGSRLRETRLRLLVPRLETWGVLLPAQYQAHGPLRLDARLDGPLRDPDLRLEVDGREAGVELGAWGVTLRDLALRAQGRPREALDFRIDARTDAPLSAHGRLRLAPWHLQARLQGTRVEVARRPDLHLFASPDLRLEAEAGRLALGGELALPQGEVMPQQATPPTQVAAEPSEDVVVIDGRDQPPPPAPRWETALDLRLTLGDRVFFQGYGLSGHVTGRLRLRRAADGPTLATGELNIREGTYDAYGQALTIERGQLVFADSPLDNPAVDIVAVRRIEDIAVGLRLTGRLKKPQVTLFADPPMNETRILSYLLFGHAPGEASGPEAEMLVRIATSLGLARGYLITRALAQRLGLEETRIERNRLVLGRRIGERLYLTYAIGLGAEPNLWVVRYRLGRNWELKAEAGAGYAADLFLTLDR